MYTTIETRGIIRDKTPFPPVSATLDKFDWLNDLSAHGGKGLMWCLVRQDSSDNHPSQGRRHLLEGGRVVIVHSIYTSRTGAWLRYPCAW